MESMARVIRPDNIARNPEKGNLCHGFSSRHIDDNISKESGRTCIKPVPRMIPEAKHLMIVKMFPSGWRNETLRLKRGAPTPIMLATRIVMIAMIFRGKALALLTHGFADSLPHSSGAVEVAGEIAKETKRSTRKIVFMRIVEVLEAIFVFFFWSFVCLDCLMFVSLDLLDESVYIVMCAGCFHAIYCR